MTAPDLSVVVTVVSGGASLRRTLGRLLRGVRRDWLEVIVPLEADHPERAALLAEFSDARFPEAGGRRGASAKHESYDRRRSAGIAASRAPVVAIIEDHGTPAADWPERVREAHARLPHAAIGGVVANGVDAAWNDAAWLCDFGRYAPPRDAGPCPALTDVNVSYKRDALFTIRDLWEPRYHEPVVHEALAARGATLWLDPAMVVEQERPRIGIRRALSERLEWGRLFGTLRARNLGAIARLQFGLASLCVVPFVLLVRIGRQGARRMRPLRLLRATPWIAALLAGWCLGEAAGTFTAGYNPWPKEKDGRGKGA